jgi:ABC-type arginine/histidine transport system permease subunit
MAATTTAFEAEIIAGAFGNPERGQMAGAAYRLRQAYLAGVTDPTAHTLSKANPKHVAALNNKTKITSFDAITAP